MCHGGRRVLVVARDALAAAGGEKRGGGEGGGDAHEKRYVQCMCHRALQSAPCARSSRSCSHFFSSSQPPVWPRSPTATSIGRSGRRATPPPTQMPLTSPPQSLPSHEPCPNTQPTST